MPKIGRFDRKGSLSVDAFNADGADTIPRCIEHIEDGVTIVTLP